MHLEIRANWPLYASIVLAGIAAFIPMVPEASFAWLMGETGPIERTTALLYLVAACLGGYVVFRAIGLVRFYAAFWMLLSIVAFGEETSWLQHELGFATPEAVRSINVQGEFNLHNIKGLHGGSLLEAERVSPALGVLLGAQNLFQIGFLAFFLLLPMLALVPFVRRILDRLRFPFPGIRMAIAIWMPIVVLIALAFVTGDDVKALAAETRELFYAAAFVLFTATLAAGVIVRDANAPTAKLNW